MKTRIAAVLAVLVVALSVAAVASAAPRQSNMKGWSHQAPVTSKTWDANRPGAFDWEFGTTRPGTVKAWGIKAWGIKGWTIRGWKVNPLASAGWTIART